MSFSRSSMLRRSTTAGLLAVLALGLGGAGAAQAQSGSCNWDIPEVGPCAEIDLQFERRFTGTYRPGEPYDVLTIMPNGAGETLAQMGIRLRLRIRCCYFDRPLDPVAGLPPEEIVLYDTHLCIAARMHADRPTDADGYTEFTGTMAGGGCAESLMLYIDGSYAGTIPIRINSPDTGSASACLVDQSDLAAFAARLGNSAQYSICFDYNESGTIDASDLAFFVAALGKGVH